MRPALDGKRETIDGLAISVMLVLTFLWGLNNVAAKVANQGFDPVANSFLRAAIGLVLILCWCWYRKVPIFDRDGSLWPGLIAGGLFGVEFLLIYVGLDYTSVPRSTLMLNTMPFWILIFAHFWLGERIRPLSVVGLGLAFSGVALVFSDKLSTIGPMTYIGDLMALTGGLTWALTTMVIKKSVLAHARAEKVLLYQIAVAAVLSIIVLPFSGPVMRDVSALAISSVVFQGVIIVAISYLVWFWLMQRYPASGLSSFAFLTPAFGVICGGLLLGEPVSLRIGLALLLIAGGLMLVNRSAKPAIARPAQTSSENA